MLYPQLLKEVFHELPGVLQQFHSRLPNAGRGHARIVRASRGVAARCAAAMRLPASARRVPLLLEVTEHRGGERWLRQFYQTPLVTTQFQRGDRLVEYVGPTSMWFQLTWERSRMVFRSGRVCLLGVPLPPWLRPRVQAIVRPRGEGWIAKIILRSPWGAVLVRYRVEVLPCKPL